ncbi:MAG: 50S ribosomal protein L21 [bacterium]|nr:50S ribosomal protein L21 [bacterium]
MLAVIETGSKQYLVKKGQKLKVELIEDKKSIDFKPLMIINDDKIFVGKPYLEKALVRASISIHPVKAKKITVLKYKPKKRYKKKSGHRQKYSEITIDRIKA